MNLLPYAGNANLADIRAAADHILEVSESVTYLGFCKAGTAGTNVEGWSILKIEESNPGAYPNTISFKWAYGTCSYGLTFDGYAGYDYQYNKFRN